MAKPAIFLLLSLQMISIAHGMDTSSEGLYLATREACQLVSEETLARDFDRLHPGYFPSSKYTALLTFIKADSSRQVALSLDFGKSEFVQYVANDKGFQRALNECYPHEPRLREFFENSLLVAENSGKLAGLGAALLSMKVSLVSLRAVWQKMTFLKNSKRAISALISTLDRSMKALVAATLLRSDSIVGPEKLTAAQVRQAANAMKENLQGEAESLESQIRQLDLQIEQCGGCVQAPQLKIDRENLNKILQNHLIPALSGEPLGPLN